MDFGGVHSLGCDLPEDKEVMGWKFATSWCRKHEDVMLIYCGRDCFVGRCFLCDLLGLVDARLRNCGHRMSFYTTLLSEEYVL